MKGISVLEGTGLINVAAYGFRFVVISTKEQFDFLHNKNVDLQSPHFENAWDAAQGSVWEITNPNLGMVFVMILATKSPSVLVHECVHMAHNLMHHTGVPINWKNTETMAYLTEHIFTQVYAHLYGRQNNE